jgi:IS1 family transposase
MQTGRERSRNILRRVGVHDRMTMVRKTTHIERFNNTLRQRVSRLVREVLSFSKKLANHVGAIKLFICHYNLTRAAA